MTFWLEEICRLYILMVFQCNEKSEQAEAHMMAALQLFLHALVPSLFVFPKRFQVAHLPAVILLEHNVDRSRKRVLSEQEDWEVGEENEGWGSWSRLTTEQS